MSNKWILLIVLNILREYYAIDINIREKQIQALEREKKYLYKKINEAIDDSVNTLKVNNDTDSLLTVNNLKDLKKQIAELNNTDNVVTLSKDADGIELIVDSNPDLESKNSNTSDVRRYNLGALASSRNPKIVLDLEEVARLLKKRGTEGKSKKWEKIIDNSELQAKLDAWVKQRQLEKAKIKNYKQQKAMRYKYERCPRFGRKNKHKRKKTRNVKYPCCRKCCKKSYLGCL